MTVDPARGDITVNLMHAVSVCATRQELHDYHSCIKGLHRSPGTDPECWHGYEQRTRGSTKKVTPRDCVRWPSASAGWNRGQTHVPGAVCAVVPHNPSTGAEQPFPGCRKISGKFGCGFVEEIDGGEHIWLSELLPRRPWPPSARTRNLSTSDDDGDHLPHPRPPFSFLLLVFSVVLSLCLQNPVTRLRPRRPTPPNYPSSSNPSRPATGPGP
jgi:hypothetical protein